MSFLSINTATLCLMLQVAYGSERSAPRVPAVAIMVFHDRTTDAQSGRWNQLLNEVIVDNLREQKGMRLLKRGSIRRALTVTGIAPESALTPQQAQALGEVLDVQRVVQGSYTRDNGWTINATVLHVASGHVSQNVAVQRTDVFEACHEIAQGIASNLGFGSVGSISDEPKRWTSSVNALASFALYYFGTETGEPVSMTEGHLRFAIAIDPQFAMAHSALGALLGTQGKLIEAEQEILKALRIVTNHGPSHTILGTLYSFNNRPKEAREELQTALRLDPYDVQAMLRLSELSISESDHKGALAYVKEAAMMDPLSPALKARMCRLHALQQERAEALRAISEAEKLYRPDVSNAQQMCIAYLALGQAGPALKYFKECAELARISGVNPKSVEALGVDVARLASHVTPNGIPYNPPKTYTVESFKEALGGIIDNNEYSFRNTLESSPQLAAWARMHTNGLATDMEKARALFDAMIERPRATGSPRMRTALEAFKAWNASNEQFACQDYSRLYVAAARDIGLQAFLTEVEQDYSGNTVSHVCAGVFIGGKLYLVDITYRWFGIEHKAFSVLDDIQALGLFLCHPEGNRRSSLRCRIGSKLYTSAFTVFSLGLSLLDEEKIPEAQGEISKWSSVYPDHWCGYLCRGLVAYKRGDKDMALASLRVAVSRNGSNAEVHALLGYVLLENGAVAEAMDQLSESLRCNPEPEIAEGCRRAIAWIRESEIERSKGAEDFMEIRRAIDSLKKLRLQ